MELQQTLQKLAQVRDELKLQAHLFKAEALDHWHQLEHHWHQFTNEVNQEARVADDADQNVNKVMRALAQEIEDGYATLKETLFDPLP